MSKNRSTARRKERFIQAIARGASVVEAVAYAGVARSTVYSWAEADPAFEEHWRRAEEVTIGQLKRKAYELAMAGNVKVLIFLMEREERAQAVAAGLSEEAMQTVRQIEIVGMEEAAHGGDFIEFVEA